MSKKKLSERLARLPLEDGERRGHDGSMYRVQLLKPLPIDFDPEAHQYTWLPTGEVMSHSVTTILRASKDPKTLRSLKTPNTSGRHAELMSIPALSSSCRAHLRTSY